MITMQDNWSNLDKLKLFPWVGHANRQNYEIVTINIKDFIEFHSWYKL
jgi:hypothetical protein